MPGRSNHPSQVLNRNKDAKSLAELVFPTSSYKLNMGMVFKFQQYQATFGSGGSGQAKNITQAHIALPLPENIQDALNINYETADLGMVAAGIASGQAVSGAMESGGVGAALQTLGSRLPGDAEYLARSAAQLAGPIGAGINTVMGNVPNPFTTAVFRSVELRRHMLNFKLVPETPQDSEIIKRIVNRFKKESLPAGGGAFLPMPSEVQVDFFGTNALYAFGRCVIQGVTVNYNPSNAPAFYKNAGQGLISAPQAVELQLQLSEIEQLLGGSFNDYGGNASTITPQEAGEAIPQSERRGNALTRQNVSDPVGRFRGAG